MTAALKTKRGRLTRYALACGWLERYGCMTLSLDHDGLVVTGRPYLQGYVSHRFRTMRDARLGLGTLGNWYSRPGQGGLRVSPPPNT